MAGRKWSEETKETARIKRYGRKDTLLKEYMEIASKYDDANIFRKVNYKIHTYLRQKGVLDVVFPNRKKYKPKGYWTLETIREEAKKYSKRTEFLENNQVAFLTSLKHKGLIDELFPKKEPLTYSLEETKKICEEYKSRMDLASKNNRLYLYAKSNDWLPEIFPDMRFSKKSKYSVESVTELAKNYKFISDFVKEHSGPYDFAHRNNLLPILFPERKHKWTEEKIIEELKKYGSKREVSKLNPSLYNTAHRKGLMDQIFPNTKKSKWTHELILSELSKYDTRQKLYRDNPSLYQIARIGKYLDKHLPSKKKIKWTDKKIISELKKYKNRKDIFHHNKNLYQISMKSGLIDVIHPKSTNNYLHKDFTHRP